MWTAAYLIFMRLPLYFIILIFSYADCHNSLVYQSVFCYLLDYDGLRLLLVLSGFSCSVI